MNRSHVFPLCGGVLLILVLSVILSGCTQPSSPAPAATPVPTSTPVPPQPAAATTVTATLPYGVTISVPGDWKRVDTLSKGTTDYGRNAVSIATFTSPPEIAGDSSSANTLDVDIDQSGALKDAFYVSAVPQLEVIVRKNPDGSYLYIDPNGATTTDRSRSRIVGYQEEDQLKPLVNAAIAAR